MWLIAEAEVSFIRAPWYYSSVHPFQDRLRGGCDQITPRQKNQQQKGKPKGKPKIRFHELVVPNDECCNSGAPLGTKESGSNYDPE
jgi:hypothetical protein